MSRVSGEPCVTMATECEGLPIEGAEPNRAPN
jgi:hypothetical protein